MSLILLAAAVALSPDPFDAGPNPLLMRHPTMNKTTIVFQFAGDLWAVPRSGGDATRVTSARGIEADPFFSPDGTMIAFTGQYDGNTDAFVVPAKGGVPRRLTYHPGSDNVQGWTPDGKSVLFTSGMLANTDQPRLFTVPIAGGVPRPLPLPSGTVGCYSPDGSKLAYDPGFKWEEGWKRYRGGQASRIWIANLADSKVKEIPRKSGENDEQPMWVGSKIYFLSDPRGPVGLSSYDTASGKVAEEVKGEGFDIKSATAGPGGIVYEQLGSLHLYDPETKKSTRVPVEINGDFSEVRPQFKDLRPNITGAGISPSGARAVIAARGWVMTVPAAKGDAHLLSETQGVHRRDPAWSPDGKTIAYIGDEGGRQRLALFDVATSTEKFVELGDPPHYYYGPTWSPDSKKISYYDQRNKIWILDLASGKNTSVDAGLYADPTVSLGTSWSPDSKWITWARDLPSHMSAVFVYSLDSGKATQITDGLSKAASPIFDRDGKHLYFVASTNTGPALSWLDMSSLTNTNVTSSVYCVVLRKDLPNPLQPESDEEKPKAEAPSAPAPPADPSKKPEPPKLGIDLPDIEHRILSLPMGSGVYRGLEAGPAGSFFAITSASAGFFGGGPGSLVKWTMADRKASPFAVGMGITVSADGSKALVAMGASFSIVSTMAPTPPGSGALDLSGLRVKIDPRVEWKSMFDEVWRNEPLLVYAANLHGIDAAAMQRRYAPFLANVMSRDDLNYLFTDMTGEISIGHMWANGGDIPGVQGVGGGLLGADYAFENGRYRLTRVYDGERWNPGLYAPLAQPGVDAKAGEYLLAIDGKDLKDSNDIYEALEGKAGRQVRVKVGPNPDGTGAREGVVLSIGSEFALRSRAWAEDNRRYVEKMTNGRAGYVHVPDTGMGGWTSFLRYYYAQVDKDGMVVDERFNHGGLINDFMVYEMKKTLDGAFSPRYGLDWPTPGAAIFGPKVMLANEYAGSGGDMFPWLFKHHKIGPVIGKRTWGGLVASFGFPVVDGGQVNSPDHAFYNVGAGTWDVEGHGVDPDVEVELDPYAWRQGHDSQLDRAIEEINKRLANYKRPTLQRPANPDKSKLPGG